MRDVAHFASFTYRAHDRSDLQNGGGDPTPPLWDEIRIRDVNEEVRKQLVKLQEGSGKNFLSLLNGVSRQRDTELGRLYGSFSELDHILNSSKRVVRPSSASESFQYWEFVKKGQQPTVVLLPRLSTYLDNSPEGDDVIMLPMHIHLVFRESGNSYVPFNFVDLQAYTNEKTPYVTESGKAYKLLAREDGVAKLYKKMPPGDRQNVWNPFTPQVPGRKKEEWMKEMKERSDTATAQSLARLDVDAAADFISQRDQLKAARAVANAVPPSPYRAATRSDLYAATTSLSQAGDKHTIAASGSREHCKKTREGPDRE